MNAAFFLAAALLGASGAVQAQQGTITFVGQIVEDTCVVTSFSNGTADGPNLLVALPTIPQRGLNAAGQRGEAIPFNLVVGTGERPCRQPFVQVYFNNMGDNNAAGRLTNRGTARNVDVVVQNARSEDMDLNTNANALIHAIDPTGVEVLTWYAAYHATAPVLSGSVTSKVQYVMDYP